MDSGRREDELAEGGIRQALAYNRGFRAGQAAAQRSALQARDRWLRNSSRVAAVAFAIVTVYVYGPKPDGPTEEAAFGVVGTVVWGLLAGLALIWLATETGRLVRIRH